MFLKDTLYSLLYMMDSRKADNSDYGDKDDDKGITDCNDGKDHGNDSDNDIKWWRFGGGQGGRGVGCVGQVESLSLSAVS